MIACSPPRAAPAAPHASEIARQRAASPRSAALSFLEQAAEANPQLEFAVVQAAALVSAYAEHWADEAWQPLEITGRFRIPLLNPDTGRPSRTFSHAGTYAGVVQIDGRRWLLEHRTTRDEIDRPDTPFWRSIEFNAQTAGYLLAQDRSGQPLAGVAYDVIRRPEIRPRLVPKGSVRRSAEENHGTLIEIEQGTYWGWPLPGHAAKLVASDGRETLQLFGLRLAADARRRPDWYFQRCLLPRNDDQLQQQARDLWQTASAIRLARRFAQHYRNPAACWNYHSPCEFLAECARPQLQVPSPADRAGHANNPASSVPREAREALTHSRMRCFQLCRRKHFYRYELGMRGAETRPAAYQFGRLMHLALSAWWQARLEAAAVGAATADIPNSTDQK